MRRVVLGDAARDDHALTDLLRLPRADANWAFLRLRRLALRDRFFARLGAHLARAEPGSLAAAMAAAPAGPDAAAAGQLPQWLFAFDATGIATFRALALLAAHPEAAARARAEAAEGAPNALDASNAPNVPAGGARDRPLLRVAVLESVRLWPTTPMLLRQTTEATAWAGGVLPAGAGVLIFVPFFHRDATRLPDADRFAPALWAGRAPGDPPAPDWPLVPFSAGPAFCPGRHLALLLASRMLGALALARPARLPGGAPLDPARPLPASLDNFALRFALAA